MTSILVFHLALLAATGEAGAQTASSSQRVHRCLGQHGEVVFSGLPCGSEAAAVGGMSAPTGSTADPSSPSPIHASCPASRAELRERIADTVARRDANGLASLLRWNGVGGAAAGARLRELRDLTQRPLLAIDDGSLDEADASADGVRVRTGSGAEGGVREHRFGVSADAGCYWLEW